MGPESPRVVIVAEHASLRFGGEAALPLHWFRSLRRRGVEAWLVVHERTRAELLELLPEDAGRLRFVPDTRLHRLLWWISQRLPERIATVTCDFLSSLHTQTIARRIVRELIDRERIDVVHEPILVSPKHLSRMHGFGVPVVIGPLNGGMDFPPAFSNRQRLAERLVFAIGRTVADWMHFAFPGKLRADIILVANERTRRALPRGVTGRVGVMIENGIEGSLWSARSRTPDAVPRFVFIGRLVDFKGVDLLLRGFVRPAREFACRLDIVGDGPERTRLEALARELGIAEQVNFTGFLPQAEAVLRLRDAVALVLPSLRECGGAVVLEALASGVCVVATDWGGPADYVDETCGILVPPESPEAMIAGLEAALLRLAQDPAAAFDLGLAGPARINALGLEWDAKAARILDIYREAIARHTRKSSSCPRPTAA